MNPLKLKIARTKQSPHDRVKRLLAKRPVALRVFEDLPAESRPERTGDVPETRGECEKACRPCPWIECRYHLAIDQTNERWGGAVTQLAPDFDWSRPSCALDVAEDGAKSAMEVAALMGLPERVIKRVTKRAIRKLEALGFAAFAVSVSPEE
jgi:hypothetical protein